MIVITPLFLKLGRSSLVNHTGSYAEHDSVKGRLRVLHEVTKLFAEKWSEEYVRLLSTFAKDTMEPRNIKVDDVCLIRTKEADKSSLRVACVVAANPSTDGVVRSELVYKVIDRRADPSNLKVSRVVKTRRNTRQCSLLCEVDCDPSKQVRRLMPDDLVGLGVEQQYEGE